MKEKRTATVEEVEKTIIDSNKWRWDVESILHRIIIFMKPLVYEHPNVRRSAHIQKGVSLHKETVVGKWSQINAPTTIGRNVFIGRNVHICGWVTIEDNVRISHLTQIVTGDAGLEGFDPLTCNHSAEKIEPVVIKEGANIAHSVTISKGVTLGKGCIVQMGASVFDDVPPYAVVRGNPAKIIGYTKQRGRR